MTKALLIFGNGLGMAKDPEFFKLERGLKKAWNVNLLTDTQKDLIRSALSTDNEPTSEAELNDLQITINAIDRINSLKIKNNSEWLTEEAKDLPDAYKCFNHLVALQFQTDINTKLDFDFSHKLSEYIKKKKPNIATLNYDNLLYDIFDKKEIFCGFSGALGDGFTKKHGFQNIQLDPKNGNDFGWYLHLHGSPLFIGNAKITNELRGSIPPSPDSHIVLTHVSQKLDLIKNSPILGEYWERLKTAIVNSSHIVLFGYSGQDTHLNLEIKKNHKDKPIHIIEWNGCGTQQERQEFWKKELGSQNITLRHLTNILEFKEWDSLEATQS